MTNNLADAPSPIISIIMGSQSDWPTMQHATDFLTQHGIAYEVKIISAHRTPKRLSHFAENAHGRGIKIIIAGAGGAAHLPGMVAAETHLPVLAVPVESKSLKGMDSLLSIVQMPAGVAVGTLAIGASGAKNAALLAMQILALENNDIADMVKNFRKNQTDNVPLTPTD